MGSREPPSLTAWPFANDNIEEILLLDFVEVKIAEWGRSHWDIIDSRCSYYE